MGTIFGVPKRCSPYSFANEAVDVHKGAMRRSIFELFCDAIEQAHCLTIRKARSLHHTNRLDAAEGATSCATTLSQRKANHYAALLVLPSGPGPHAT